MSKYRIQIVDTDTGLIVHEWLPGMAVEKEFETELINRVKAKGVGILRTEAHVLADLALSIREMLFDLKAQV